MCLISALAASACSSGPQELVQPAPQTGPRLSVGRNTWGFGEVSFGEHVDAVFHPRNKGDSPTVMERAFPRVMEGCCPPQPDLEATQIPAGEIKVLAPHFTMGEGMVGPHVFEVTVQTNDAREPETVLTVRGTFLE